MPNPWLNLPLADYESHMSAKEVQQLEALSDLFATALNLRRPKSVAILGIAGGNGLNRIDPNITQRIVGIDINPHYLEATRNRNPNLPNLDLHCIDIAEQTIPTPPVDLVHAALVFEHAGATRALENALSLVAPSGAISIVLQLPGVPPTGYMGIDRVLGTLDGLKRFITIQESPYHGLNFCQGTVSEMLADPGTQIFDVIRYFGARNKIFNVHFRNIRGHRNNFVEVYPDEGDVDMVHALNTYIEVGYPYMLMPDHVPTAAADPAGLQSFAFCYGYIRGLIQSAQSANHTNA